MDAESSEVLGMWEGEFGEGRRDSECSGSGESGAVTYSEPEDSLYIPTPDRPRTVMRPIEIITHASYNKKFCNIACILLHTHLITRNAATLYK